MKTRSAVNRKRRLREFRPKRKPPRFQDKVMREAQRIIESRKFDNLRKIEGMYNIGVVEIDGRKIVIKDTLGKNSHGKDYKELRHIFLQHQLALSRGEIKAERYIVRTPKVYGIIGNYLVMAYAEGKRFESLKGADRDIVWSAYRELEDNLLELERKKAIKMAPQRHHLIVKGNTNQEHPRKGKWIFYFVYDYR